MIEFLSDKEKFQEKERLYLEVRNKEGRVPDDDTVRTLPNVHTAHPLRKEWRKRKRSLERLKRFLQFQQRDRPVQILDLGCGNGWMSNRLAETPTWHITAVDVNAVEMEQGDRLFARENLRFIYTDILEDKMPLAFFDVVVLAGAVQYFPDFDALMLSLFRVLVPGGEIHIIDSPFYHHEAAKAAAAKRSRDYYLSKGVEQMANYYHHHTFSAIDPYPSINMNQPFLIRLLQKTGHLTPFPWIRIRPKMQEEDLGKN